VNLKAQLEAALSRGRCQFSAAAQKGSADVEALEQLKQAVAGAERSGCPSNEVRLPTPARTHAGWACPGLTRVCRAMALQVARLVQAGRLVVAVRSAVRTGSWASVERLVAAADAQGMDLDLPRAAVAELELVRLALRAAGADAIADEDAEPIAEAPRMGAGAGAARVWRGLRAIGGHASRNEALPRQLLEDLEGAVRELLLPEGEGGAEPLALSSADSGALVAAHVTCKLAWDLGGPGATPELLVMPEYILKELRGMAGDGGNRGRFPLILGRLTAKVGLGLAAGGRPWRRLTSLVLCRCVAGAAAGRAWHAVATRGPAACAPAPLPDLPQQTHGTVLEECSRGLSGGRPAGTTQCSLGRGRAFSGVRILSSASRLPLST
jgi:hypothetical protein